MAVGSPVGQFWQLLLLFRQVDLSSELCKTAQDLTMTIPVSLTVRRASVAASSSSSLLCRLLLGKRVNQELNISLITVTNPLGFIQSISRGFMSQLLLNPRHLN